MSHICIGVIIGKNISKKTKHYFDAIKSSCIRHKRFLFFLDPIDKKEPLFSYFESLQQDYLFFSIADNRQYNNIEDMFITSTESGPCWDDYYKRIKDFQSLIIEIRAEIPYDEELYMFIGNSGTLYNEFEVIVTKPTKLFNIISNIARKRGEWDDNIMFRLTP